MFLKTLSTAAAAAFLSAGVALAGMGAPAVTGKLGDKTYLMDQNKMTLYTFDKDAKGVSNCYGACAEKWPPLLAEEGAELGRGYSLIKRKDGTMQVAYHGHPLYLWFKDKHPGDMTGDGVKGVWHIAVPGH